MAAARKPLNLTLGTWRSILVGALILLPLSTCLWLTMQAFARERSVGSDLSRAVSMAEQEGNPDLARKLEELQRSEESASGGLRHVALALAFASAAAAAALIIACFRTLDRNLKTVIAESEGLAAAVRSGRLGVRGDALGTNDDFRPLIECINEIMESVSHLPAVRDCARSLAESSQGLSEVSEKLTSAVDQTAVQATVVSSASEQVSRNVQTLATGAEEMTASIREIAKNAYEAAQMVERAVKVADEANTRVRRLGEGSLEIGKIVVVITSVAEQTNLLALNAAIEAARAGKAGKGFAVVANEVKELARETARASEDINRRVKAIQDDTTAAVDAIARINSIIHQISDFQNTIASAVEEQSVTSGEIGRNIAEVATGSSEIARNVALIAAATQGTTAGANHTRSTAAELEKMAARLEELMGEIEMA